jgi:hypothetical protein
MKIYNVFWDTITSGLTYCGSFSNETFAKEYVEARNNDSRYIIEEEYVDNF